MRGETLRLHDTFRNPITWYLALTLGVPLMGGSPGPGYAEHAATVLALAVPFAAVLWLTGRRRRARRAR